MKASVLSALMLSISLAQVSDLSAQSVPYFQGKTIMLIQGREPGGTGALRAQAAIPFLRKYIPGEPVIVTPVHAGRRWAESGELHVSQCQA